MNCTRSYRGPTALLALSLLLALVACAPQKVQDPESEILAVQAERFRAIVAADLATLDAILAPDLVYTHSHGGVESRAEFLDGLGSGAVDYLELTPENVQVRVYDDTAVVTGDVRLRVAAGGQQHRLRMRFTEVYVHAGESWQLVAWQSTQAN